MQHIMQPVGQIVIYDVKELMVRTPTLVSASLAALSLLGHRLQAVSHCLTPSGCEESL